MDNPTIISHCAIAAVSMRIVPNQDIADICAQFKYYVCDIFNHLKSDNRIKVIICKQYVWADSILTYLAID
jgi:di- and tripeptidase